MGLGPELIFIQSVDITREFSQNRVRRATAGDCWLVVSFSRDRALCFSWDPEFYGICRILPEEVRELEGASSSRPPVLDAVRSHIVGADLECAVQINRDRVMKIEFRRVIGAGFFQTRYLLFEASGRYSNIIILDENGGVIEAAKHIFPDSNRFRSVIPGHQYAAPPDFDGIYIDDFDPSSDDAVEQIGRIRGIGRPLAGAVKGIIRADSDADGRGEALAGIEFFKKMESPASYQLYPASGNYLTCCPFHLPGAKILTDTDSLSATRRVVVTPIIGRRVANIRKKISSRLDVLERANEKKIGEYSALCSGTGEVEQLKLEGQLILANAYMIQPRAESAMLTEWTEDGPLERRVTLDPNKDASTNAEARFTRYRRKKAAVEAADKILPKLFSNREEISEQRALLECNDDWGTLSLLLEELAPSKISGGQKPGSGKKSDKANIPPHRRIEFPDADAAIFCGLSARGNRYVTFKLAKSDDLWLHAQGIPGAHVILRFNTKSAGDVLERMIGIAASCAVFHSAHKDAGSIRVDYAERRYVRSIPGEGPANVTYKEFCSILVDASLWSKSLKNTAG